MLLRGFSPRPMVLLECVKFVMPAHYGDSMPVIPLWPIDIYIALDYAPGEDIDAGSDE